MQEMSDTDLNYLFNLLEEKNIPIIHPRKHSYIMHQGIESEYIYILKKGVAKLSNILRDGREFSTFYVTDTDFVSLLESKDRGNINTSVFSVRVETSDTYFYKVPRKKLDEWVNEDNCLSNIIGNFYKRRLIHNIEVHKRMSVNGKKGAVYACLSIMVDYFGIKKTEGILIDFKLTNDDIAGFCGISTRNSVNRILDDLLVLSKFKPKIMKKRLEALAPKLNIENFLDKQPFELSGGQKQRVAVTRALISQPDLVLADEPTAALDFKNSEDLLDLFEEINAEGQTIIMVTHSSLAASHAKRVLFIKDGVLYHQLYRRDKSSTSFAKEITLSMSSFLGSQTAEEEPNA